MVGLFLVHFWHDVDDDDEDDDGDDADDDADDADDADADADADDDDNGDDGDVSTIRGSPLHKRVRPPTEMSCIQNTPQVT